jgi:hypothetical protein
MKWAYLFLGVFAAFFAVLFTVDPSPDDPPDALRVSITACVVNLGIFLAIHYAQRRAKKPIQTAETTRGK